MQFGAMNFPIIPLHKEIDTFARLGFDYLELAMDPPMANYDALFSIKTSVKQQLMQCGLGLVCHLPTFVSTADLTESIRHASVDEMLKSLDLAAELGALKVVLHPSMVSGMGGFVVDTVKTYAFDFLSKMVKAAHELNLTICLENMFPRNQLGVEPADMDEILRNFPSLKLTLDTGHANIYDHDGRRMNVLVKRFGKHIGHLHFSDNNGMSDQHLPIGQGNINFTELVHRLKVIGYDDTLTLEVFDTDRQVLVDSREQIKMMFANARR
jgi:sugar phosphate isomerase/epimerase